MGKTHNWVDYNRTGDVIEITIRNSSGAKMEKWVINCLDKKRLRQVMRTLKEKWGVDFRAAIIPKEKDLEWLE